MYPELMVIPMREELVRAGINETRTAEDVDAALAQPGTTRQPPRSENHRLCRSGPRSHRPRPQLL